MRLFENFRVMVGGKRGADALIADDLRVMKQSRVSREGIEKTKDELQRLQNFGTQNVTRPFLDRSPYARTLYRVAQSAGATIFALAIFGGGWVYYADRTPDIKPTRQVLPSPNGYDALILATRSLPSEKECEEWFRKDTLKDEADEKRWGVKHIISHRDGVEAGEEAFLEKCESAFQQMWKSMLTSEFVIPYSGRLDVLMPELHSFQTMAKLLLLKARHLEKQNKFEESRETYLQTLLFLNRLGNAGTLTHFYVSANLQAKTVEALSHLLPYLSEKTKTQLCGDALPVVVSVPLSLTLVLIQEEEGTLKALFDLFARPDWRSEFRRLLRTQFGTYLDPGTQQDDFATKIALYTVNKKWAISNYKKYMAEASRRAASLDSWKLDDPDLPYDLIVRWVTPLIKPALFANTQLLAQKHLLLCAYYLKAYYATNGKYPDQLKNCTTDALVLSDPFTDSSATPQMLRYKRVGKGYLLYSVGPDGKDDGGKPVANPKTHKLQTAPQVTPESVGDIVFDSEKRSR
ncbi:MAG: hypothetical protein H7308_18600 [Chthonomonadaceae bacterium]|nr:hypothetical protein [Chthonomonadaceae bacterium]